MPDPHLSIAALIDHTLLKPDATAEAIRKLCAEAREHRFAALCVNPYWVPLAVAESGGIPVASVIGFPLGANAARIKVAETEAAVQDGAREIDVVLNIGELAGGDLAAVRADLRDVAAAAHGGGAIVKAILETALLSDGQKRAACTICEESGVDFVKTSTGFAAAGGATAEDVALLRASVSAGIGVKASGGIRTLADLLRMVEAGANRIGTSSGVAILKEAAASAAG